MAVLADLWRRRFPPEAAQPAAEQPPPYDLGGDAPTPSRQQIDDARKRQRARREAPDTLWRRLTSGPDIDCARAAIVCATDEVVGDDPDATQRLRTIRALVFESQTEIYARNLRVSSDRLLLEFRHPELIAGGGRPLVGLRFVGLSANAWVAGDFVGLHLNGTVDPIATLFSQKLNDALHNADLAESYVRFAFDHVTFNGEQLYVISDDDDFIFDTEQTKDVQDKDLISQFRVPAPPPEADPKEDALARALKIPRDALIPQTYMGWEPAREDTPEHATVFATVIYRLQLYHLSLAVQADGLVVPTADRRRTPEGESLALVPVRSFVEQHKALKDAFASTSGKSR